MILLLIICRRQPVQGGLYQGTTRERGSLPQGELIEIRAGHLSTLGASHSRRDNEFKRLN